MKTVSLRTERAWSGVLLASLRAMQASPVGASKVF
jgi:hypothetical protein